MTRSQLGQTLVAFAILLPLVLLPVAAYAIQAALLTSRASLLQAAAGRAAEDASQALDEGALRSAGVLRVDPAGAARIARLTLAEQDPAARLDHVSVGEVSVAVTAHDSVPLAFGAFLNVASVTLHAVATARLTPGYGAAMPSA